MTPRLLLGILVALLVVLRLVQRAAARKRARAAQGRGFHCPSCGEKRLVVASTLALPDESDLEAVACRRCPFRGVAVHRENPASHQGHPLTPTAWGALSSSIACCPSPLDRTCGCAEHHRLRDGLSAVPHEAGGRFLLD